MPPFIALNRSNLTAVNKNVEDTDETTTGRSSGCVHLISQKVDSSFSPSHTHKNELALFDNVVESETHQAGKHGENHLGFDLDQVFREGVQAGADLTGHGHCVFGVVEFLFVVIPLRHECVVD